MKQARGVKTQSMYLTMRDGVKIAVDLHLPPEALRGDRVPTIIRQTRYLRSVEFRRPFDSIIQKWFVDTCYEKKQYLLARGYAWVDVDARGSGVSYGERPCPWYEDEVRDGADIVDWIIAQPWSNGNVGATGVSYDGTACEMLMINRHPAVKAVIPQFSLFDTYTDVAFPGGVHQFHFTECWSYLNDHLDGNDPQASIGRVVSIIAGGHLDKLLNAPEASRAMGRLAGQGVRQIMKHVIRGAKPVDDDPGRDAVHEAVSGHGDNFNVHEAALTVVFRDEGFDSATVPELGERGVDVFSPHNYLADIDASGTAVFSYAGWWDMSYQHAAIKRQLSLTNPDNMLIIGPWDHGGKHDIGPSVGFKPCKYDHNLEFLKFFDYHLKGKDLGLDTVNRIRYYTMGEEKWKSTAVWPLPDAEMQTFYLGASRRLESKKPAAAGAFDPYVVDYTAGTGDLSRWKSGLGMPIDYSDRKLRDKKLLVYDSPPLERDTEVTGHPVVTLFITSDADDGFFFVYLEEVTPSGKVRYVTEGCLRAVHRKLSRKKPPYAMVAPYRTFEKADAQPLAPGEVAKLVFDLLPTSYLFKKRHSIRVAIAGMDCDHTAPPPGRPPKIQIHRNKKYASHIHLPVVER